MIILAIVPLIAVGALLTYRNFNNQEAQAENLQAQTALRVAHEVENFITARPQELSLAIKTVGLAQGDPEKQQSELEELVSYDSYVDRLTLLDAVGTQIAYADELGLAATEGSVADYSSDDAFVLPTTTREIYYGRVFFDETTGEPFMTISIPMINPRNDVVDNVLIARIQFKTVWNLIAEQELVPGQDIYVVDTSTAASSSEGQESIIAHRDPSVVLRGTTFQTRNLGTSGEGLSGEDVIFGIQPIELGQQRFSVVSELTTTEAYNSAYQSLYTVLIGLIAIIITSALVGYFMLRQVTAPLAVLTTAAQKIGTGDLNIRVGVGGKTEIGVLARTFNGMAEQLGDLVNTLEDRVQARTRDLQLAAQVSEQAATILDPDALLTQVVDLTKATFGLYHAHVYLLDRTTNILNLAAGAGEPGRIMIEQKHSIPLAFERSLVARAARDNASIVVNNVRQELGFMPNPLLIETQSEAAFPLAVGRQVLGVLDVQSEQVDRFDTDLISVLTTLARQIAVSVRNANLFDEVQQARERAVQADKVKSAFLASMSHELRTPLNAVINFTKFVLNRDLGPINEQQEEVLTQVASSGRHLLGLINDVLDMSKIEAGALNLFVEDNVDLRKILDTVVLTGRGLLSDKPVDIQTDFDTDLPGIRADRQRVAQILLNIVSNACKFTEGGSIKICAHVVNSDVIISVQDTGPGIAPDDQTLVFEAFKQTSTGLRHAAGTGLGMPISKSLVEAHGGSLRLESEVGKGATFTVSLPIRSDILVPVVLGERVK
jgi:signal transduction histidine kinase/HAMP domain-containing protein